MPLVCAGEDCPAMQGLSLRNVAVTVYNGKKKAVFRDFGELLFTHFGVSGPLVLSASAHLRRWEGEHYTIEIDLKPALDEQKLDARVLRDIGENPNREMGTIAAGLVPPAWRRWCCAGRADRKRKGQQPDKGTAPGTGAGAEALYAGTYRAAARQ